MDMSFLEKYMYLASNPYLPRVSSAMKGKYNVLKESNRSTKSIRARTALSSGEKLGSLNFGALTSKRACCTKKTRMVKRMAGVRWKGNPRAPVRKRKKVNT